VAPAGQTLDHYPRHQTPKLLLLLQQQLRRRHLLHY
jgi:hypothetical protein